MMTELSGVLLSLLMFSLVLSAQIVLVLLLRKPVRRYLGAIACYRLWLLALLWLPAYTLGGKLLVWWQAANPRVETSTPTDIGNFQLLLNDWLLLPLENLGNSTTGNATTTLALWEIAALLWLAGACLVIVWQVHKYRRFSQQVQQQARPAEYADAPVAASVFGNTLKTLVLPGMSSAALFGVRNPVLLLPEHFGDHYDKDQQHIILAHEAVHLRRHDNAWNLAACALVVLSWPNPLFWLAWRCFRFDQELSCDAQALTACTQTQQQRYAHTLLDAASTSAGFGPQPALSAWDDLNDLKERTLMIAQHMKNKVSPLVIQTSLSAIALCGAVAMVVLAGSFSPPTVAAETESTARVVADEETGRVLRDAIELLNAEQFAEARAKLNVLAPQVLSPYERSRVEQMFFSLDIQQENYAGARAHMEAAIASGGMNDQEVSTGRYQLAQLWLQEEKWAEGATAIEEWLATATDPKGGAYYLLAVAYYNLDQFDKALPPAQQAVALGGDLSQESWLQMLTAVYLQTGQYEQALPVVRDQVRRFPDKEVYRKQLAAIEGTIQQAQAR